MLIFVIVLAEVFLGLRLLSFSFWLMNQPNDMFVFAGAVLPLLYIWIMFKTNPRLFKKGKNEN